MFQLNHIIFILLQTIEKILKKLIGRIIKTQKRRRRRKILNVGIHMRFM